MILWGLLSSKFGLRAIVSDIIFSVYLLLRCVQSCAIANEVSYFQTTVGFLLLRFVFF